MFLQTVTGFISAMSEMPQLGPQQDFLRPRIEGIAGFAAMGGRNTTDAARTLPRPGALVAKTAADGHATTKQLHVILILTVATVD